MAHNAGQEIMQQLLKPRLLPTVKDTHWWLLPPSFPQALPMEWWLILPWPLSVYTWGQLCTHPFAWHSLMLQCPLGFLLALILHCANRTFCYYKLLQILPPQLPTTCSVIQGTLCLYMPHFSLPLCPCHAPMACLLSTCCASPAAMSNSTLTMSTFTAIAVATVVDKLKSQRIW